MLFDEQESARQATNRFLKGLAIAQARLTAREVDVAYRKNEPIFLSDGGGLYLRKRDAESASWTLRYRYAGRDRCSRRDAFGHRARDR